MSQSGSGVDEPRHDLLVVDLGEEWQRRGHQSMWPVSGLHQAQPRVCVHVYRPQPDGDGRSPEIPVQLGHEVLDGVAEGAVTSCYDGV